MRTSIILPTYNERENLRAIIERIVEVRIPDLEVLIIDDGSPDGTGVLAEELAREHPCLRVLHRERKAGLGAALIAGFRGALDRGAEVVVQMDADGSHDPAAIPSMLAAIARGADLVVGSRRVHGGRTVGWGIHRRLASWGAQWIARQLLGFRTRDITSGFRAWRAASLRDALRTSGEPTASYAFQVELLHHTESANLRTVEHPITFRDRTAGRSKLGWRDVLEFFRTLARLRWHGGTLPHLDGVVTWGRLPRDERRFALLIGLSIVLLTGLPTVYGWIRTPPGYTFLGTRAVNVGDAHVYYSDIEQVRDGSTLLVRDLFTGEPQRATMLQPAWSAVGLLARATGWSAPLTFHVARLALIVPFVMFLAVFVATFLRAPMAGVSVRTLRRTALLLTIFGSGVGALIGAALPDAFSQVEGRPFWPLDLGVTEAFAFLTLAQSPHFILSLACMLAVYLATVQCDRTHRARWTIAAMLSALALFAIHPFYVASVPIIVAAHAVARMLGERRWLPHIVRHTTAIALAALLVSAYWLPLATFDPIHASRAAQNILRTPPLRYVLLGYGFLLPLAGIGAITFLRDQQRNPALVFLFAWTMVNALLLYAPFPWQRRFVQGLAVALALLGTVGIARCVGWLRVHLPHRWVPSLLTPGTALAIMIPLLALTNIVHIGRDLTYYTMRFPLEDPRHMFYYPTAGIDAMRWLRAHTDPHDVVLTVGITANILPGWAARPVFAGHAVETVQFDRKDAALRAFLDAAGTDDDRRAFLRASRIRSLFVPTFEPQGQALHAIARDLMLPIAYANAGVTIYRVPEAG